MGSRDCDLTNFDEVLLMLEEQAPDAIIHLAARVGGIKDNAENQAEYFDTNVQINTNLIRAAHRCGIERILASLSTCAFPDKCESYPYSERTLFTGPPALTNFSYGFSKRMLHVQCMSYRKQHGRNYSTFCPSNIYGPHDNFDLESSHFVAALIRKVAHRTIDDITMWGTGEPLRQQLFVNDLAELMPLLLDKHNGNEPLIVAGDENLSIAEMCYTLTAVINEKINFKFNNKLDGQFRKDGNNELLKSMLPTTFSFTKFAEGIEQTYEWYKSSTRHNNTR